MPKRAGLIVLAAAMALLAIVLFAPGQRGLPGPAPAPTARAPLGQSTLSLAEIQARAGFPVRVPTTLPPGFVLAETYYEEPTSFVALTYARGTEHLLITQTPMGATANTETLGAGDFIEPVRIGGVPGEFIRGYWDTQNGGIVWNPDYPYLRVRWTENRVLRQVSTESGQRSTLTREDLVRVAAGMK